MISLLTPASEQGQTLGVAQSAASLARILGPLFATSIYVIRPSLPYLVCGGVALIAGLLAWHWLCQNTVVAQKAG
jgi:hypothetical protein